jgi:hypothetical protein
MIPSGGSFMIRLGEPIKYHQAHSPSPIRPTSWLIGMWLSACRGPTQLPITAFIRNWQKWSLVGPPGQVTCYFLRMPFLNRETMQGRS